MIKFRIFTVALLSVATLQGCSTIMTPIGKEDFACPNEKKGGVCAGPRTIYELTNTRENLENLENDEDYNGYVIKTDDEGNTIAVKNKGSNTKMDASNHDHGQHYTNNEGETIYEPRSHAQQSANNFQPPKVIPQIRNPQTESDAFHQWPTTTEPLAPEPLSVLEPPKVMRILLNTYKDAERNLHIPGYLYVQVEEETWAVGEAASMRPQRVVPLEIREKATNENSQREHRQSGVSALEHQEIGNGG